MEQRMKGILPVLTREQVNEASLLRRTNHLTYAKLAQLYGVSQTVMYKHLNDPSKATRPNNN